MLADAGVDVLVMDVTNAVRYWDEWEVIFPVMQKMKAEGNKVPAVLLLGVQRSRDHRRAGPVRKIYKAEQYQDLWFYWDGKPLLLYNGTPSVDANGQVPTDIPIRTMTRPPKPTHPPALRRPRLHRGILQRLHEGGEGVLHAADHVVGIL